MGVKLMPLPEDPWVKFAGPALGARAAAGARGRHRGRRARRHYESLSLLALEALAVGTPVLCNARSEVLVEHCRQSNAGLYYADRDEFIECAQPADRRRTAARGDGPERQATTSSAEVNYRWDVILSQVRGAPSLRPAKAPGSRRVLVIGDSYTWGYAVAEEEAFPQVAERLLRDRGRADIEVINAGVPDYNSRQERQLLEQLLPIYQPDAVFLAYVVNDAEPPTAMPVPPEEAYRHSRTWFLTETADHLNRRVFRRRLLPTTKVNVASSYLEGFEPESVKWRDSREAIRQMRDLSQSAGASGAGGCRSA
jgi:hypothetical protein